MTWPQGKEGEIGASKLWDRPQSAFSIAGEAIRGQAQLTQGYGAPSLLWHEAPRLASRPGGRLKESGIGRGNASPGLNTRDQHHAGGEGFRSVRREKLAE